jgi:hypothetical protein
MNSWLWCHSWLCISAIPYFLALVIGCTSDWFHSFSCNLSSLSHVLPPSHLHSQTTTTTCACWRRTCTASSTRTRWRDSTMRRGESSRLSLPSSESAIIFHYLDCIAPACWRVPRRRALPELASLTGAACLCCLDCRPRKLAPGVEIPASTKHGASVLLACALETTLRLSCGVRRAVVCAACSLRSGCIAVQNLSFEIIHRPCGVAPISTARPNYYVVSSAFFLRFLQATTCV